jgi:HSP20 family molecular chaperone IbpA
LGYKTKELQAPFLIMRDAGNLENSLEKVVKLKWFYSQHEGLAYELSSARYTQPEGWRPPINAFRCEACIQVCFDLAGVSRADVELRVEPMRLIIHGVRRTPEPASSEGRPRQILAMEIDHGLFARELKLPAEVVPSKATTEQRDGLLWIKLPLAAAR